MAEHWFDDLARAAAAPVTRREAMRRMGVVVGGVVLASVLPRPWRARAQVSGCPSPVCTDGRGVQGGVSCNGVCCPSAADPKNNYFCCGTDGCVRLGSDPDNCGHCGLACGTGVPCVNGVCGGVHGACGEDHPHRMLCGTECCKRGDLCCDGKCVNVSRNRKHCGSCDEDCEPGQECVDGVCCTCCGGICCAGDPDEGGEFCCNGTCCPAANNCAGPAGSEECCPSERACNNNTVCCAGGPPETREFCCNGTCCQEAGHNCAGPAGSEVCCESKRACNNNTVCCSDSAENAQFCCNGTCCPEAGHNCAGPAGSEECCPSGRACKDNLGTPNAVCCPDTEFCCGDVCCNAQNQSCCPDLTGGGVCCDSGTTCTAPGVCT